MRLISRNVPAAPAALLPTARLSLKLALVSAFALASVTSAWAAPSVRSGTIGGSVTPINTLTDAYISDITIVAATGQTDTTVVTGTIDNNFASGWKLTIVSGNTGKLLRGGGGAGREIPYTNITFVKTGGTLGDGLTDPAAAGTKNIATSGTTIFNTGSAVATPLTATTATVGCAYALKISWSADTTLLSGTYTDTLTLTLANDT